MGVSVDGEIMGKDRYLEHTDKRLVERFEFTDGVAASELLKIPALVMPELQDKSRPPFAYVGKVVDVELDGRDIHYRFIPDASVAKIPSSEIEAMASDLHINTAGWEFTRTHWAVKDVDLYRALLVRDSTTAERSPSVFTLPNRPVNPKLVSLMMPFGAEFGTVHTKLRDAIRANGWECKRADDIWDNDAIIQDVVDLIADGAVVICDLSGKNANVFYETGIAHAIGKNVILLAQHQTDVPFDLRHLRYVAYHMNEQGIDAMVKQVITRLDQLMSR